MQLIANALREDVAPVEQAKAWDRLRASQGLTLRQLGDKLGYDYSTIARGLDLLKLAPEIQAQVDAGEIAASTAGQIARIDNHEEQQAIAVRAVTENLSRADVAEAIKAKASPSKIKPKGKAKHATVRKFKGPAGLVITVERSKGLDPALLLEAFERVANEIRDEMTQEE